MRDRREAGAAEAHEPDPKVPPRRPPGGRDARIVRTGAALRDALLALLERKPLDQITVREIAGAAGIHYATFFRHHATKEALLDHVAADQIDRLVELTLPVLDTQDSRTAFVALFAYVEEHRLLWTALLTGGAAGAMREELLSVASGLAVDRPPVAGGLPVDLAIVCTVTLIVETLAWWLRQPAGRYPIAAAAELLHTLVSGAAGQIDARR